VIVALQSVFFSQDEPVRIRKANKNPEIINAIGFIVKYFFCSFRNIAIKPLK
jgi:hypothetical protein